MLDDDRIAEVVAQMADTHLSDVHIKRVFSETMIDGVGGDAIRITLVLEPEDVPRVTGDQALDLLVAVNQTLETEGEHRNPVIEYATEQDLQEEHADRRGEPGEDDD